MEREEDMGDGGLSRIARIAVPVIVVGAIAGGIWYLLQGSGSERREAPPLPTLQAFLPPPPPPPKEKPPEPEKKVVEEQKVDPTPKQMDAPKPLTINGPAQAGSDAFNLASGDGSGDIADGFGTQSYSRYLTSLVQDAVEQDEHLNHLAFNVQIAARVDQGRRLHARIIKSSGDSAIDGDILSAAENIALDEGPPGAVEFRMAIHSRRPA